MQHPPKRKETKHSRRRWLLPSALVVLAAAVALTVLLPRIMEKYPAKVEIEIPESTMRTLAMIPTQQVDSITVFPPKDESYTLQMQDGTLMLQTDDGLADVNDLLAEELLEAVTQIVAQAVVAEDASEVEEHLADMGLNPPYASAQIRYTDGTTATLEVGGGVPNTTYAYCRWSGSPAVYMCDVGVSDALQVSRRRMLPVQQPVIYETLVEEAVIRNAMGEMSMTFEEGGVSSLRSPWIYPMAEDAADTVLSALSNFRLGTYEAVVTPENRADYGFDDPLCVIEVRQSAGTTSTVDENGALVSVQIPAQQMRYVIGREEGEFFYTCEYEGKCYLISRFLSQTLVSLKPDAVLSRSPLNPGDLSVRSVVMEGSAGDFELQIGYQERLLPNNEVELDSSGNPVYDALVTLNGAEVTVEKLDVMLSRLVSFAVTGDAPAGWQRPDEKPLWSLKLTAVNGMVRTIEAWQLDLFTHVIAVDGVALHTVDAEAAGRLAEGYQR